MTLQRYGHRLGRKHPRLAAFAGAVFTIVFGWVATSTLLSGEFTSKRGDTAFADEPGKFIFLVIVFYALATLCAVTAVYNWRLARLLRQLR